MQINIERDNADVENMLMQAKHNIWYPVFQILKAKPYLINCIPETKAWSALHQAVYWDNKTAVTNLLQLSTCDALVESKACEDNIIKPNTTAIVLAELKGLTDIQRLLKENIDNHRCRRFGDDVPRFVQIPQGANLNEMGIPLLVLEIVLYKHTLLNHHTNVTQHSIDLMESIFENERLEWHNIKQKLYEALYTNCKHSAKRIHEARSETEFFQELIRWYTDNYVYSKLNIALGRAFGDEFRPAADDLALGLYGLLLDLTITYWDDLEKVGEETYRGLSKNVTNDYVVGTVIMFTGITSCSLSRTEADKFRDDNGTLFIFNNSQESIKRPRNIRRYSKFENEEECVYIVGTKFKVVRVDTQTNTVELELL